MKQKIFCVLVMMFLGALAERVSANTLTVTDTTDSDPGSLRAAIANASPGDTINVTVTGAITVNSTLVIGTSVTIVGPGAANLTISGNGSVQVFEISNGASVVISGLTIANGNAVGNGGGVGNFGALTISNAAVSDNFASGAGGGIFNAYLASLTVVNSTISGNAADGVYGAGGGIYNSDAASLTISNTTISGNSAPQPNVGGDGGQGGGMFLSGNALVTNTTIAGNTASYGNDVFAFGLDGGELAFVNVTIAGDIYFYYNQPGTYKIKNSIIGQSCASEGGIITSLGHNLSQNIYCAALFNQIGDIVNTSPGFDPAGLASNGGSTLTIALLPTSAAVNAIPVAPANYCTSTDGVTPVTQDQRGVPRPQGQFCDIGAYELSSEAQQITFNPPAVQVVAGAFVALSATASSGFTVSFASMTPAVCVVSGTTVTTLSAGSCIITASQAGGGLFAPAAPVSQSFSVTRALPTTAVTLGISSGTQTYPVWNNFVIGPTASGARVPTGTVTLYDNGTALATLKLGSNGLAYYTANPLNVGSNVMTASYSGDVNYAASASAPVVITVNPAPVDLTASCVGGSPYQVAYRCTVNVSAGTSIPPSGSISFSFDADQATVVALSNGNAAFTVSTLPAPGAHTVIITYGGQGNYAAGKTITESFVTAPGATQLLVSASSFYLSTGSSLALSVNASTPTSGVPIGSVTLYDNGTALGTAEIGSAGVATYTVGSIGKGMHVYTATYAATADFSAAASLDSATVTAH